MNYAVELASGDMVYRRRFMMMDTGILVILRLMLQQFYKRQCQYY
jgi:hypothetical protein